MYTIQLNEKGSKTLQIEQKHLETIQKYHLFDRLKNSSGFVTETELEKLRKTLRSLIVEPETKDKSELLDLCIDVIYHDHMKAYGLEQLMLLYFDVIKEDACSTSEGAE